MEDESLRLKKLAKAAFNSAFKNSDQGAQTAESKTDRDDSIADLIDQFEQASQKDDDGVEYWYARDLQKLLAYLEYRNFQPVIAKAIDACGNSGQPVENHFVQVHEMVEIGSNAERQISDYKLTANQLHLDVGKRVRQTIRELGGTMPESLAPAENVERVAKRLQNASLNELQNTTEEDG